MHILEIKNTALLSKWLYRLLKTDGTWQQILRNKYLGTKHYRTPCVCRVPETLGKLRKTLGK